jgi:hypothetical protein
VKFDRGIFIFIVNHNAIEKSIAALLKQPVKIPVLHEYPIPHAPQCSTGARDRQGHYLERPLNCTLWMAMDAVAAFHAAKAGETANTILVALASCHGVDPAPSMATKEQLHGTIGPVSGFNCRRRRGRSQPVRSAAPVFHDSIAQGGFEQTELLWRARQPREMSPDRVPEESPGGLTSEQRRCGAWGRNLEHVLVVGPSEKIKSLSSSAAR